MSNSTSKPSNISSAAAAPSLAETHAAAPLAFVDAPTDSNASTLPGTPSNDPSSVQTDGQAEEQATEGRKDRRSGSRENFGGAEQRKNVVDRRAGLDRRVIDIGAPTGLERRRGPGRRRAEDRRSAEEGEMTDEQFEFVMAIDTYKRLNGRPFPTWTEVLEVVKQLGYRKVAASSISLPNNNGRATEQQG
jgi:hypothetical protein